jgi:hypothetical protein
MKKVSCTEATESSRQAILQDESLREDRPLGEVSSARMKPNICDFRDLPW